MKHEGILLHQYHILDEMGKVIRTIKATKKVRKILARLAVLAPQEWPLDEPFIKVLEPALVDYGYIPRVALLSRGKSVDEVVPGSRNRYMITANNPATIACCPQKDLWEDDVKNFFEPNVKKGNYVKVEISYSNKGKLIVGPQVIKKARLEAVAKKKEADKSEANREDVVPPKDAKPHLTKKEKERAKDIEKAKEEARAKKSALASLKDKMLKPKEGKK